jgi:ADP-dependent NAD(P)H-hydrate dehydratase / NAD(P)H-hydrate epimerase
MRQVVTPDEMGKLDRATIDAGTPETELIERAGTAVAWQARQLLAGTYGRRVVVACGKGNNGADGRVAARVLRGWGVRVVELAIADGLDRDDAGRELARADLFVDAMFGTGFRGALGGDAAWLAEETAHVRVVLAVDIPSGVDGLTGAVHGPVVRAHTTVCFAYLKPGLLFEPGKSCAGSVEVVDIGIHRTGWFSDAPLVGPASVHISVTTASDARTALGVRAADEHKWRAAVLVVGGSAGMIGAPGLTARAALRTGSGMVVAAVPGTDAAARIGGGEVVARAMPRTSEGALAGAAADELLGEYVARFKAVALGPGLGRARETAAAVARLVTDAAVPMVIDADALTLLAEDPTPFSVRADTGHSDEREVGGSSPTETLRPMAVITPHDGEYERLAGHPPGEDRIEAAWELASRLRVVVLLKGPATVVAHPDGTIAVNPTGSPALATAGTGDVLTGIVAALLARGAPPFTAAAAAAWIHGRAAEVAGTAPGLVAGDLIDALPRTLRLLSDPSED